ncbi:hypothetical protein QMT40_001771 [Parvibaculaceae bacterium PLY_AMNH_Bact1]|nr:hypothetical protein QMT40_001771 [Parvibaculaceae bacterium PLY_AMNH_Bact1]
MITYKKTQPPPGKEEDMKREFHSLANLFPLLEGERLRELCEDVRENGLIEPIWLYEGKILDGRNRYRACQIEEVEPRFREFDPKACGDDPLAFVTSLNLKRRHLNSSQRAMVASKIANLDKGANQHTGEGTSIEGSSKLLNVGKASVERARSVRKHAVPEVVAEVEAGTMSVNAADKLSKQSPDVQRDIARTPPKQRKEKMSASGVFTQEFVDRHAKERGWMFKFEKGLIAIHDMPVSPQEYIDAMPDYMAPPIEEHLEAAVAFLTEFSELWNKRKSDDDKTIDGSAACLNRAE